MTAALFLAWPADGCHGRLLAPASGEVEATMDDVESMAACQFGMSCLRRFIREGGGGVGCFANGRERDDGR